MRKGIGEDDEKVWWIFTILAKVCFYVWRMSEVTFNYLEMEWVPIRHVCDILLHIINERQSMPSLTYFYSSSTSDTSFECAKYVVGCCDSCCARRKKPFLSPLVATIYLKET